MAVVAEYRNERLKTVVRIHDDCMVEPEKRQEIYDRVFNYMMNATIRAYQEGRISVKGKEGNFDETTSELYEAPGT